MPSQPNADSPYLASRLQADMGVRVPGTPTSAGKPGAQAADLSFPAPPAPASAPAGRPPATPSPAPATPAAPATPGAAPARPAAPQAQPGAAAAPTQPGAAVPPAGPPVLGTPAGVDAQGNQQFALSPDGDMRFRQAMVQRRADLGPLPRVFRHPSLPEMPVELGHANYNPFTGTWVK